MRTLVGPSEDAEDRPRAPLVTARSLVPAGLVAALLALVGSGAVWVTIKVTKIDRLDERMVERDAQFLSLITELKSTLDLRLGHLQKQLDAMMEAGMTKRDFDLWVLLNQRAYPNQPLLDRPK